MAAGTCWLGLVMWLFFGSEPILDLDNDYAKFICWVFIMMTFVPFLALMDTEIKMEKDGKKWSVWGAPPREEHLSNYETYKKELRRRVGK